MTNDDNAIPSFSDYLARPTLEEHHQAEGITFAVLIGIILLLLTLVGVGGIYYYGYKKKPANIGLLHAAIGALFPGVASTRLEIATTGEDTFKLPDQRTVHGLKLLLIQNREQRPSEGTPGEGNATDRTQNGNMRVHVTDVVGPRRQTWPRETTADYLLTEDWPTYGPPLNVQVQDPQRGDERTDSTTSAYNWCCGDHYRGRHTEEQERMQMQEVILFAGRKLKSPKWMAWFTYIYFVCMAFLILVWFMVILTNNLLYRKTTTCNDINVNNDRYGCYYALNFSRANCSWLRTHPDVNDISVICYLVNFDPPMALGVATGFAKFIAFVVDVSFRTTVILAGTTLGCVFIITLQVFGTIALVLGFCLGIGGVREDGLDWFLYGFIPMRLVMLCLVLFLAIGVACLPWWAVDCSCTEFKDVGVKECKKKK